MVCLSIFCKVLNMILELMNMTGGRYRFGVFYFRLQTLDMIVVAGETAAVLALWYGVKPIYPPPPHLLFLCHMSRSMTEKRNCCYPVNGNTDDSYYIQLRLLKRYLVDTTEKKQCHCTQSKCLSSLSTTILCSTSK